MCDGNGEKDQRQEARFDGRIKRVKEADARREPQKNASCKAIQCCFKSGCP
jgi:hypothetical protein